MPMILSNLMSRDGAAEDTVSLRSCDESEASGSDTLSPYKKQGDDQYPKEN